jgi:sugar phosphate isomerase/epimerase
MEVGFLTACMGKESLEEIIKWAAKAGVRKLEVIRSHLGEDTPKRDAAILKALKAAGVALSSIAAYDGDLLKDPKKGLADLKSAIDRCVRLDTNVCCALAGIAPAGVSREQAIDGPFTQIFGPACDYAAKKGVKIALENWFATLIMNFDQWDRVLEKVPAKNLGFNYDPSHLMWQGIDYVGGVTKYGARIFHTHAKDTEVVAHKKAWVGNQDGGGWWRYVIPGFGDVKWGPYLARLRSIGYNGVLSIEHEDGAFSWEDGFRIGAKYLGQFI